MEHQLRVVLLSPCSGGHVLRVGEPPSLGAVVVVMGYACGLGLFLWHGQSAEARLYFVSRFAPSRFVEFLLGVFSARLFLTSSGQRLAGVSGLAQATGIGLIIAGAMYRPYVAWPLWGGLLYVPGSILLILGLAHGRGFFVAHLSRPGLNRLGVARLRGGRDRDVHGRPDRRLADLLRIRDPIAKAFEEFPRPAA